MATRHPQVIHNGTPLWRQLRYAFYITTMLTALIIAGWLRFTSEGRIEFWTFILGVEPGSRTEHPEGYTYVGAGLFAGFGLMLLTMVITSRRFGKRVPPGAYWCVMFSFLVGFVSMTLYGHYFAR